MSLQGTPEWRQERCGSIGASDAPAVVRKIKSGGYSADRDALMARKVLERLTGVPVEIPVTAAMRQGIEREPDGRLTYTIVKGLSVEEVGLMPHPTIAGSHASPDGLVEDETPGLVEIKCPLPAAHLDTLTNQTISGDYQVQMLWQMRCTGRSWCDYVSYNPDFPGKMKIWIKRFHYDAKRAAELEREVKVFIEHLENKVAWLTRHYAIAA